MQRLATRLQRGRFTLCSPARIVLRRPISLRAEGEVRQQPIDAPRARSLSGQTRWDHSSCAVSDFRLEMGRGVGRCESPAGRVTVRAAQRTPMGMQSILASRRPCTPSKQPAGSPAARKRLMKAVSYACKPSAAQSWRVLQHPRFDRSYLASDGLTPRIDPAHFRAGCKRQITPPVMPVFTFLCDPRSQKSFKVGVVKDPATSSWIFPPMFAIGSQTTCPSRRSEDASLKQLNLRRPFTSRAMHLSDTAL